MMIVQLPYGNWLLRVLCAHKHVESRFSFYCTVQFSFGARSPAWVDGIADAEWKGLPGAVAFWQIAALCRQPV